VNILPITLLAALIFLSISLAGWTFCPSPYWLHWFFFPFHWLGNVLPIGCSDLSFPLISWVNVLPSSHWLLWSLVALILLSIQLDLSGSSNLFCWTDLYDGAAHFS
jgi:hypothetical protein